MKVKIIIKELDEIIWTHEYIWPNIRDDRGPVEQIFTVSKNEFGEYNCDLKFTLYDPNISIIQTKLQENNETTHTLRGIVNLEDINNYYVPPVGGEVTVHSVSSNPYKGSFSQIPMFYNQVNVESIQSQNNSPPPRSLAPSVSSETEMEVDDPEIEMEDPRVKRWEEMFDNGNLFINADEGSVQ